MTQLVVRPLAEADIDEAFAWYETRSVSLGVDFLRRRALLRRFPYAELYMQSSDHIEVLACTHTSLHPRRWRRRA